VRDSRRDRRIGSDGVTVAPLASFTLPPGYQIIGSIIGAVAGDAWLSALCWTDYVYTTPPGIF